MRCTKMNSCTLISGHTNKKDCLYLVEQNIIPKIRKQSQWQSQLQ